MPSPGLPTICSDSPRRTLIIMANYSQNPSNKSNNMYVIIELVLRTPGQQSTTRNCFCTEHKTRFAVSYTSQARNRFHTTKANCPSHLLYYALLTRCHPSTSQIITNSKHINYERRSNQGNGFPHLMTSVYSCVVKYLLLSR